MRNLGSFHGVKRPGRLAEHSPQCSAEVKNYWSQTPFFYLLSWRVQGFLTFTYSVLKVFIKSVKCICFAFS
jgi:hypothetical protein